MTETSSGAPPDTRRLAFALLRAVFGRRRPLDLALDDLPRADARDRAAAHRLAAGVLRHAGTLDAALEPFLRRAPPDPVRDILRIGAAQLLFLDTPAHAAVATSVALARAENLAPFAGLANAVLRRLAAASAGALDALDQARLDTPAWLWSSWGGAARAIAEAHRREAPLDLTLRAGSPIPVGGMALPTRSVRFPPGTPVADLPGWSEGAFWVQDAAAALPARLLGARPGEFVADLGAAPGGKTAQLADTGATVFAVEREARRIPRLRDTLGRLGLAATIVHADAARWQPPAPLDAVLLDAPCSATGTIRRHPDVPHIKRESDLPGLVAAQRALLAAAVAMLKPGGRLLYAVCSLQQEEGEDQAAYARALGLIPAPFAPDELAVLPDALTPDGYFRTTPAFWPERGGLDGFFAARFRKAGTAV